MTMLGKSAIIEEVSLGRIKLEGVPTIKFNPNSINVTLDNVFYEVIWVLREPYYIGPLYAGEGDFIAIPNGGTLLARTREIIGTFEAIAAEMSARSSSGRMGFGVCKCAGFGDVGFYDHWVMELTGFSRIGRPTVRVGEEIAQLSFHRVEGHTSTYDGQYKSVPWPEVMIPRGYRYTNVISPEKAKSAGLYEKFIFSSKGE